MKRAVISLMTVLFSFSIILAQPGKTEKTKKTETSKEHKMTPLKKMKEGYVSNAAKDSFLGYFGNVPDVQWERRTYFDEAVFSKNGKTYKAFFDFNGQLVGSTTTAKFSDLPESAQKEILNKYKGYSIVDVIFFDDNEANEEDMILYGQQFEDADNYFVVMEKGPERIVLQANTDGDVFFFKTL